MKTQRFTSGSYVPNSNINNGKKFACPEEGKKDGRRKKKKDHVIATVMP